MSTAVRAARYRSTPGALAPDRVMLSRSILAYTAPSAPLAGTSRLRRRAAYTQCLRCAAASATHERFRAFVDYSFSACRPLRPREVHRLLVPSSFADDAGLRPLRTVSALPKSPHSVSRGGIHFGAYVRFALATTCRVVRPPDGADQVVTQPTGTFTSGLSAGWSPAPPPDIATVATGRVPPAGLSPARTSTSLAAPSGWIRTRNPPVNSGGRLIFDAVVPSQMAP